MQVYREEGLNELLHFFVPHQLRTVTEQQSEKQTIKGSSESSFGTQVKQSAWSGQHVDSVAQKQNTNTVD